MGKMKMNQRTSNGATITRKRKTKEPETETKKKSDFNKIDLPKYGIRLYANGEEIGERGDGRR